jgi:hypothetical protein
MERPVADVKEERDKGVGFAIELRGGESQHRAHHIKEVEREKEGDAPHEPARPDGTRHPPDRGGVLDGERHWRVRQLAG